MIQISPTVKSIIIVGLPATGKTELSKKLSEAYPHFKLFHTDDYIPHGFKESLQHLKMGIEYYQRSGKPFIVEGVQGYRLIRSLMKFDLIIHCICYKGVRLKRRPDISSNFDHQLINWWKDYQRLGENTPVIEYDTTKL